MIQRKQTLFLLLAAIVLCIVLFLPLGYTEEQNVRTSFSAFCGDSYSLFGYGATLLAAIIIALADIFLWNNRPLQMRIATLDLLLVILSYGVFFIYHSTADKTIHYTVQIANFLPIIAIFSLALAIQGIRKDEKLIKSLNRIR